MSLERSVTIGHGALPSLARAGWDELLDRAGCGDPLRRMAVLALPDPSARRAVPRAIVVSRDGTTVAAAALGARRGRGLTTVGHLGDQANWFDPAPPAVDEAARAALVEALLEQPGDLLLLDELPGDGEFVRAIAARRPDAQILEGPATFRIAPGTERRRRSLSARRREVGRLTRRAAERGTPLAVTAEGSWEAIRAQLPELLAMQEAAWKGRDPDDFTGTSQGRSFVAAAITALGTEGRVRLVRVEVGGRLAAFHLALVSGRRAILYKTAFDRTLTGLPGLGWCSLLAMIDRLEAEGVTDIDLGPWGGGYKAHIADPEPTVTIRLALSAPGRAYLVAARAKRGAQRGLSALVARPRGGGRAGSG